MQNTAQVTHKLKTENTHLIESQLDVYFASLASIDDRQLSVNNAGEAFSNSYTNSCVASKKVFDASKKQICLLKRDDYSINVVDSLKQRIKTSMLIKSIYASRGYLAKKATTFTDNPYQITLEATRKQQLLGTLTLTVDSNQGLLSDTLYKQDIDAFRVKERKVCEISKLAFGRNSSSKRILAELFHVAYIYASFLHEATDAVIEVNPRHASFYKRMLGFRQINEQRICPRVNAPAVLLHLECEKVNKQRLFATRSDKCNDKSIYPYFLSRCEEAELMKIIFYRQAEMSQNCFL